MRLAVGLDVTACTVGSTGVGRYGRELWARLVQRPDLDVKAFALGRGPAAPLPARRLAVPLRLLHPLWRVAGWPTAETIVGQIDVMHTLDLLPAPTQAPVALHVHDDFAVSVPSLTSPRSRRIQAAQLKAARDCRILFTISQSTADTISAVTGVPRDRVVATGMAPLYVAAAASSREPGEYILAVGAITPRKGFDILAAAVNQVPGCPPLRIAGPDGWAADEVRARVRDCDPGGKVSFLGPVTDQELGRLYLAAVAYVQASLAEGFGMATLDAMASHCPVVATDLPTTREVAGDAALLVPAGNPEALAAAIRAVLDDPAAAASRVTAGLERCRSFTWEAATDRIVEAYRVALG
ncbi:MAG: hypothetical protein QOK05_3016 [Chloroflexota bacterium]|nr:hypothetical protein [Chloroflexota bacterium]